MLLLLLLLWKMVSRSSRLPLVVGSGSQLNDGSVAFLVSWSVCRSLSLKFPVFPLQSGTGVNERCRGATGERWEDRERSGWSPPIHELWTRGGSHGHVVYA